jgi:hypothetical protein
MEQYMESGNKAVLIFMISGVIEKNAMSGRKMKAAFLEKLNKRNNKKQDETKKQPS